MSTQCTSAGYAFFAGILLAFSSVGVASVAPDAEVKSIRFDALVQAADLRLRGTEGAIDLPFSLRRDEVVQRAYLDLQLHYSPSLLKELSHLRVRINGQTIGAFAVESAKEEQGFVKIRQQIDPRLMTDFNHIELALIGHYTLDCEDAMHTSLWADIAAASTLNMEVVSLASQLDLSALPRPFFDPLDARPLNTPFGFSAAPSIEVLHSAGIVASWLGAEASYRGAEFSPHMNADPEANAIVFATNTDKPTWLELSKVELPTISLRAHPNDPDLRLLILQGRDAAQLRTAALALALAPQMLSGSHAQVQEFVQPPPRKAYDARRWIQTDAPVALGDLVGTPDMLQRRGHLPQPIRINLNLPPDLMTWNGRGVPMDLQYRYTPPTQDDSSALTVAINEQFLHAFRLQPTGENKLRIPLMNSQASWSSSDLSIPAFHIGTTNQLQFQFALDYHDQQRCSDTLNDNVHAAISPTSTIDFSGFAHYVEMPNLALYAGAGFPFSKYADLQETVVLLPATKVSEEQAASVLFHLGRLGRITGEVATRFEILTPNDLALAQHKDILAIGLPDVWKDAAAVRLSREQRELVADRSVRYSMPDAQIMLASNGPVALSNAGLAGKPALLGFESPLQPKRSVIAIAVAAPGELNLVNRAIADPDRRAGISGDVALISDSDVDSMRVGGSYYVGSLSWYRWVWFHMSRYPVALAVLSWLGAIVLAVLVFWMLRRRATRRPAAA